MNPNPPLVGDNIVYIGGFFEKRKHLLSPVPKPLEVGVVIHVDTDPSMTDEVGACFFTVRWECGLEYVSHIWPDDLDKGFIGQTCASPEWFRIWGAPQFQ